MRQAKKYCLMIFIINVVLKIDVVLRAWRKNSCYDS